MATSTDTVTAADVIRRYAEDLAFVADETPATDLSTLIDHLETAASRFDEAGINGHEDMDTAATFLGQVSGADGDLERGVFLRKADDLLYPIVWDMTEEYRSAVAD
jgi:hypothetical protein